MANLPRVDAPAIPVDDVRPEERRRAAAWIARAETDARTLAAGAALADNRLDVAQPLLRALLKDDAYHVPAMRMLAEVAARVGRTRDAENLLTRAVALAPGFLPARRNLALLRYRQNRPHDALRECDAALAVDPADPTARNLKAAALGQVGDYAQAIAIYEPLLAEHPGLAPAWMSYGHALKTFGRRADCEAAYARAVALRPQTGEAWWSLANLKNYAFSAGDVARMEALLADPAATDEDRWHLHFTLGKALEDAGDFDRAFAHYDAGNRLRRAALPHDPADVTRHVDRSTATFDRAWFAARAGRGEPAADPIFIVGLPRAGSTLIEQILASHSAVEGTMELPEITMMATRLADAAGDYRAALADADLAALGRRFIDRTRAYRKTGKPFFIDKMPNNFLHIGLIHAILPNARVIDARRHPLGCSLSGWKQHFARGQAFSYGLDDIGRYYVDYLRLMRHYDRALPADRLRRVVYEDVVADLEGQVRGLLGWLGLPFEEACLRFHENSRAVRTASSEQVRQPLFTDGVDQWRSFDAHLGPLRAALGDAADNWRD